MAPNTIHTTASVGGQNVPNNDVISLQYMELEEFLLENAVAVVQQGQQQQQDQQAKGKAI